jgi:cysteinyl-tRNA synthetase
VREGLLTLLPDGSALVKLIAPRDAAQQPLPEASTSLAEGPSLSTTGAAWKSLHPRDIFRPPNVAEGAYSTWDEQGIPLTDGRGEPLSKSRRKKLQKTWNLQLKVYQKNAAMQSE